MDSENIKSIFQNKIFLLLFLSAIISSCTETYNLQTNTYEEALVVEATITNEVKRQEIKLTKTSQLEEEGIKTVTGAIIIVHDNKGNNYSFKEQAGTYLSETEFKAEPNTEYTLEITANGQKYQSKTEVLTTENEIESITPEVVTNSKEGRGVQINVKSYDPANTSKYYRYVYEETYKIIAPKWLEIKLVVIGDQQIDFVPNDGPETRTCYSTKNSNDIIQTTTTNLQEDRVSFPVRFISDQNYIISHRYSILVKQYIQNLESYTFYKTLKEISSSSGILSPKQPGFLNGNIKCVTNSDKKAIGFFDVSSVSSKRIYFNYADLFPGEPLPPYYVECKDSAYKFCFGFSDPPCLGRQLIYDLKANTVWYSHHDKIDYYMVPIECGDCTSFSSNVIPSFWTE